jgi:hypothetical protein
VARLANGQGLSGRTYGRVTLLACRPSAMNRHHPY